LDRRELLEAASSRLAALAGVLSLPPALFFWRSARLRDPEQKAWADLGAASRLEGERWQRRTLVRERVNRWRRETQQEVVYLRRRGEAIEALSAICPHTGCLVGARASGFECPCHKSRFDADGRSLEGPSPRPLDPLECRLDRGRLYVKYERFRPGTSAREPLPG
jgi:Rieske Fe-S protein